MSPTGSRSRSIASVSSLVQACGANASIPGSNRPPPLGAGLEQDVRERRRQPGVQLVDAEDVAVEELALPVGRRGRALYGSVMVRFMSHLTYEIGALERTLGQDAGQVVDDLRARHVEDELLAALGPRPAGDADRPVRVRLEQLGCAR